MNSSSKILISAGVIAFLTLLQIGLADQLVSETTTSVFTLRSPILIAMSVIQLIFGFWALADVTKKIEEDVPAQTPAHKRTKHSK